MAEEFTPERLRQMRDNFIGFGADPETANRFVIETLREEHLREGRPVRAHPMRVGRHDTPNRDAWFESTNRMIEQGRRTEERMGAPPHPTLFSEEEKGAEAAADEQARRRFLARRGRL